MSSAVDASSSQLLVLEANASTAKSLILGGMEKSSKQALAVARFQRFLRDDELKRNSCEVSSRRAGR